MRSRWLAISLTLTAALSGCGGASSALSDGSSVLGGPSPYDLPLTAALAHLDTGATQLAKLCSRGGHDLVTQRFCVATPPPLHGLADLQSALGLGFADSAGENGRGGNPGFALSANSSSLVTRFVSSINPRAIVFSPPPLDGNFAALAFTRGEQFVELASYDPVAAELNFYLVVFTQACSARGCDKGELLTSAVERDWTGATIYEDEDLGNTPLDCKQCHQPDGPDSKPMLRMQERLPPYTHFFAGDGSGLGLAQDFAAAHGDEGYGPIPPALIAKSDPAQLAALVTAAGFAPQPNEIDFAAVAREEIGGGSPTWQSAYDEAASGHAIAVPYHEPRISDPVKLAAATAAYRDVLAGARPRSSLPDIRDVLADGALRDLTLLPANGLDGKGLLVQMCQQCHNDKLDQTLTRARFDVTRLLTLSATERDLAIARIESATNADGHMPPAQLRALSYDEVERMVEFLQQ